MKYATTVQARIARDKRIARVIRSLLKIAEIAMPDTYFATDRRVNAARKLLKEL